MAVAGKYDDRRIDLHARAKLISQAFNKYYGHKDITYCEEKHSKKVFLENAERWKVGSRLGGTPWARTYDSTFV